MKTLAEKVAKHLKKTGCEIIEELSNNCYFINTPLGTGTIKAEEYEDGSFDYSEA